jgi:predicted RNase H-related nuclease YkuK (DUF458 family)
MDGFKILNKDENIDLVSYIKTKKDENPNIELLIGCDSQNHGPVTVYAVVVGLYNPGKGAHVLYKKTEVKRLYDLTPRLLNEVWLAVETAEFIKEELDLKATFIDIDLNSDPNPRFKSNQALANAVGIVKGMGYEVRYKGKSPLMVFCADNLVKRRKRIRKKKHKKDKI